jgi:hypothetical protein
VKVDNPRIDLSRARTFVPRPAANEPEDETDGAVALACCVFSLTMALIGLFGTGAWPFVKAWLLGWL